MWHWCSWVLPCICNDGITFHARQIQEFLAFGNLDTSVNLQVRQNSAISFTLAAQWLLRVLPVLCDALFLEFGCSCVVTVQHVNVKCLHLFPPTSLPGWIGRLTDADRQGCDHMFTMSATDWVSISVDACLRLDQVIHSLLKHFSKFRKLDSVPRWGVFSKFSNSVL